MTDRHILEALRRLYKAQAEVPYGYVFEAGTGNWFYETEGGS